MRSPEEILVTINEFVDCFGEYDADMAQGLRGALDELRDALKWTTPEGSIIPAVGYCGFSSSAGVCVNLATGDDGLCDRCRGLPI